MTTSHEVFVALLNEGTPVWRPVPAKHIAVDIYLLQGNVPDGESWQFLPNTQVRCKTHHFTDGENGLVAIGHRCLISTQSSMTKSPARHRRRFAAKGVIRGLGKKGAKTYLQLYALSSRTAFFI